MSRGKRFEQRREETKQDSDSRRKNLRIDIGSDPKSGIDNRDRLDRSDKEERRRSEREELSHLLHGIGAPPTTKFVPDQFQLDAINLVTEVGCDVLVSAPTGSGKTWIATESIKKVLETGSRAWYMVYLPSQGTL
jgi:superfamily II RNA helicase